ncbi:MAG: acetyl-COA carboxylase, partial [Frankiales bacterium]|nr:acetyl-COA carboxylase [Frankiales bacterium]
MAATADSVLVADRGVAAVRVIAALQRRGTKAVSVHTEADAGAVHATLADESVLLGPTTASYGDVRKLIEAARQAGAQGVHPA